MFWFITNFSITLFDNLKLNFHYPFRELELYVDQ